MERGDYEIQCCLGNFATKVPAKNSQKNTSATLFSRYLSILIHSSIREILHICCVVIQKKGEDRLEAGMIVLLISDAVANPAINLLTTEEVAI